MSTNSKIEWTDETWNPVRGCTKVSTGCKNCYAETFAERWRGIPGHAYEQGFDLRLVPEKLDAPLHWRKPRRVFVNSMSDLFHEGVPFEFIDRVFAVMALTPHHTYQVLTKRPARMAEYMASQYGGGAWNRIRGIDFLSGELVNSSGRCQDWPLPNVWAGTSVENQAAADERIPHLLKCPAPVRFLSVEPLLGQINLFCRYRDGAKCNALKIADISDGAPSGDTAIHWVIVGGESGPGARPCDVQLIRDIVKQCKEAGVPCFVKQLGANIAGEQGVDYQRFIDQLANVMGRSCYRVELRGWPGVKGEFVRPCARHDGRILLTDPKGGAPAEWPEDLRVREFPEVPHHQH